MEQITKEKMYTLNLYKYFLKLMYVSEHYKQK